MGHLGHTSGSLVKHVLQPNEAHAAVHLYATLLRKKSAKGGKRGPEAMAVKALKQVGNKPLVQLVCVNVSENKCLNDPKTNVSLIRFLG